MTAAGVGTADVPDATSTGTTRDGFRARRPGGRRRRADDDEAAEQSQESTGRRYRPEGEPWQVPGGAQESTGGRRRAPDPEDDEPSGSHSSGRSVSELLAAYGAGDATPRRRRRAVV